LGELADGLTAGAEAPGGRPVARVLLDSALPQLDHLFDYAIPEHLSAEIRAGQRVQVPFRSQSRKSYGYVIGFAEQSEFTGQLQSIAEIVGPVSILSPEVWALAREVSDRAAGSACDVLRLAIPQRMVRVEKEYLAARASTNASPTPEFTPAARAAEAEATGAEESAEATADHAASAEHELAQRLISGDRLSVLASHGPVRLSTGEWVGGWALRLAQAAIAVHAAGRSVIIIAPDYRDVDQLRDTLAALGHVDPVLVSARQSNGERYAQFLRALEDTPRIVLGNRSAIYAPASRLGAILIWDDGDPVLAEPRSPYVHARDAALVRAQQSGSGLCFAAHMRSAEVQRLVDLGYVLAEQHPPKRSKVVHADAAVAPEAFAGRVPEFAAQAIRVGLAHGPVLVQVATPGYAPVAVCADCGELARCRSCGGPVGFRSSRASACRWCAQPGGAWGCESCGGRQLVERGMGSQRTVEQFERQFAGVRVLRSDGDHPIERVDSRSALIVATRGAEPIAAGGFRAVILLDIERLLSLETLRAGEDCLRWWHNAAALAAPTARVVVASGGGPVVRAFLTGHEEAWLRSELRDRHALRYPPAVRVASVTGGSVEVARAVQELEGIRGVDVLGPAPAPVPRGERSTASDGATTSRVPLQRAIIRFDYASGSDVAKRLRGVLVADAAGSSAQPGGRAGRARSASRAGALRLRFDDRGVFDV